MVDKDEIIKRNLTLSMYNQHLGINISVNDGTNKSNYLLHDLFDYNDFTLADFIYLLRETQNGQKYHLFRNLTKVAFFNMARSSTTLEPIQDFTLSYKLFNFEKSFSYRFFSHTLLVDSTNQQNTSLAEFIENLYRYIYFIFSGKELQNSGNTLLNIFEIYIEHWVYGANGAEDTVTPYTYNNYQSSSINTQNRYFVIYIMQKPNISITIDSILYYDKLISLNIGSFNINLFDTNLTIQNQIELDLYRDKLFALENATNNVNNITIDYTEDLSNYNLILNNKIKLSIVLFVIACATSVYYITYNINYALSHQKIQSLVNNISQEEEREIQTNERNDLSEKSMQLFTNYTIENT